MLQIVKKTILVLLVFLLPILTPYADAKPISQEMAQQIAEEFLINEQAMPPNVASKKGGEFIIRDQAMGLYIGQIVPFIDKQGTILAYIQELEPYGFIITSADDNIKSVLGFSFTDNFSYDKNKSNPLIYLIEADVQARKQSAYIENTTMGMGFPTEWGPWLQTEWHQTGHWNNKCPYTIKHIGLMRRPVGCVATALAQIVNYWKYPKSVRFSDDDYFYISDKRRSFDESGNWGFPSLQNLQTSMSTLLYDGNKDEEAYLSFAAGVKLHMDYGILGSGANTYYARNVLNKDFGFGSAIAHSDYDGVWFSYSSEIIYNIENGWPVQIAIHKSGKKGGHSIVVDGYRDDGFFHLNYGWGANSPDPINTTWYDIPTTMPNYNVVHTVVLVFPRKNGHGVKLVLPSSRIQSDFYCRDSNDGVYGYKTFQYNQISSIAHPFL